MRTLKELNLSIAAYTEVTIWLKAWADHIAEKIGDTDKAVQAKKIDFKNMKLFYFTSCADIIGKDPMFKDPATEQKVIARKMQVYLWLFIKYLIDQTGHISEQWKICSHCGKENCELDQLPHRMGHYQYCPDCGKTAITIFPVEDDIAWEFIKQKVWGNKSKPAGQDKTFLKDAVKSAIKESKNLCPKPTGQDITKKDCNTCLYRKISKISTPCIDCIDSGLIMRKPAGQDKTSTQKPERLGFVKGMMSRNQDKTFEEAKEEIHECYDCHYYETEIFDEPCKSCIPDNKCVHKNFKSKEVKKE